MGGFLKPGIWMALVPLWRITLYGNQDKQAFFNPKAVLFYQPKENVVDE